MGEIKNIFIGLLLMGLFLSGLHGGDFYWLEVDNNSRHNVVVEGIDREGYENVKVETLISGPTGQYGQHDKGFGFTERGFDELTFIIKDDEGKNVKAQDSYIGDMKKEVKEQSLEWEEDGARYNVNLNLDFDPDADIDYGAIKNGGKVIITVT